MQISKDDGGYYSSYAQFNNEGKLILFFNDDKRNYNSKNEYVGLFEDFSKKKKYNVMAVILVDHETGALDRKVLFSRAEVDAIGVPRKFEYDKISNRMILYANIANKRKVWLVESKVYSGLVELFYSFSGR